MTLSRRALFGAPLLAQAQVTPSILRLAAELEPLAQLFESTDRDKCPALLAAELKKGTPLRQLMAALFLAGIRNVNPRPPGFALHCVFVMHSAHQLSLEAAASMRHLPLFFALDQFKASQARDKDFTMGELTGPLPAPDRAPAELDRALENWEFDRAERAAAVLARHAGAHEVFSIFWKHGVRDYRNIGHKAIYVANAYRTLETIGWRYAEPVLRSIALALCDFGPETKMNGFAFADQTWNGNLKRSPLAVANGPSNEQDVKGIVAAIRAAAPPEACADAVSRLAKGATAASIWDAVHLASAELTTRLAGGGVITGIHAASAANAMHFAWQSAADARTRWLILLQSVGWMAQFRVAGELQTDIKKADITSITAGPSRVEIGNELKNIITKANEVHYYKFPVAIAEDYHLVSERWRPAFASAIRHYTKTAADPDIAPMKSAMELL
jgi:hypothetical protein